MQGFFKKLSSIILSSAMLVSTVAFAWEPGGPVTVVVPAPPGSLHDASFRSLMAGSKSKVVYNIEYKPGASGIVGTKYFLEKSDTDQTLLISASLSHSMSQINKPELVKWNPFEDFTYLGQIVVNTLAITVSQDSKLKDLDSLVKEAKEGSKPINVAVTMPNQTAIILELAERIKVDESRFNFVKYTNPGKALTDLVGGNVDVFVGGVPPTVGLQSSGKVKWIAITSESPSELMKGVPTLSSKFPGLVQVSVASVLAHKNMSKEAVEWYRKNLMSAVNSVESQEYRTKMKGFILSDLENPEKLKQFHIETNKKLAPVWVKLTTK